MNVIIIKYQFIFNFVACNLFVDAQINIPKLLFILKESSIKNKQHLKDTQIGLFIFGTFAKMPR